MEPKRNPIWSEKGDRKSNLRCEKNEEKKQNHCAELQQLLQKTYVIIHNAFWHMRLI